MKRQFNHWRGKGRSIPCNGGNAKKAWRGDRETETGERGMGKQIPKSS